MHNVKNVKVAFDRRHNDMPADNNTQSVCWS